MKIDFTTEDIEFLEHIFGVASDYYSDDPAWAALYKKIFGDED